MLWDAAIVLQARMGSVRLPGKVLAPIGEATVLRHCIERLLASRVGPVVLATTTARADDEVAAEGERLSVPVLRGPEADVLVRFVWAARALDTKYIVRATADNPAVDIDAPRRTLEGLVRAGADHCCETGLPIGAAVEAMTTRALLDADVHATSAGDREHVTPFIRRERWRYRVVEPPAPAPLTRPDLRLTVDTREDLDRIRTIAGRLARPLSHAPLADIITAADRVAGWESVA